MPLPDQIRKELKKEGEQQQPDMHPINVCISSYYNFSVSKPIQTIFNIQRMLQEVKFLIFIYNLLCEPKRIKRLTSQAVFSLRGKPLNSKAENSLSLNIS